MINGKRVSASMIEMIREVSSQTFNYFLILFTPSTVCIRCVHLADILLLNQSINMPMKERKKWIDLSDGSIDSKFIN